MSDASAYFVTEGAGEPAGPGRFIKVDEVETVSFAPGLTFRPVLGDNVLVNHVHFEPHVEAPTHVHVEEQIVVVLDGEFEFWIDDESRIMRRGDVAVVPPWVPHGARTHESSCMEIDVFQPPRSQILKALGDGAAKES
jgi:quercetin dioxygenase-like cupin family protein